MNAIIKPTFTDPTDTRPCVEHRFMTHDGVELFYRHWPAKTATRRGAMVLFHRGHEHGARMAHLVNELQLPEFDFFAWDARGHGKSPGTRGFSPSFGASVRDVQTFITHIAAKHHVDTEDIFVIAQSVGAVLVSAWVHDYAPRIRGMSLASPAFKVKLYVPFARTGIRLWQALMGPFFVNSYVKARYLTHDPLRVATYESDPLISRPIASHILLGLYDAAHRVVTDAAAITLPTQVLISGADWVVHKEPQRVFHERLSSTIKEVHELPGFFHDTLGELKRDKAVTLIRQFATKLYATNPPRADVRNADQIGPTCEESHRLAAPLSPWSARGVYWALTRFGLKLGGVLSAGIHLGHQTGFDSGSTLDYIYRNCPQGLGPLGRLIDKVYLSSIGWRGIRVRKTHVEELLCNAVSLVHKVGLPIRLMDVAAGHGRYVLDAVPSMAPKPDSILLRDYSELNVQDGTALISSRGLQNIARFEQADAFDRANLAAVSPAPTVAVVSGLYELFADNAQVNESLAGIADAMPEGGILVYTGQPWHPQLELIARALTSHRQGQAWVMRRRTQQEMDQLVEAAGFRKLEQRVDEWGIFTVATAVRVRPA